MTLKTLFTSILHRITWLLQGHSYTLRAFVATALHVIYDYKKSNDEISSKSPFGGWRPARSKSRYRKPRYVVIANSSVLTGLA